MASLSTLPSDLHTLLLLEATQSSLRSLINLASTSRSLYSTYQNSQRHLLRSALLSLGQYAGPALFLARLEKESSFNVQDPSADNSIHKCFHECVDIHQTAGRNLDLGIIKAALEIHLEVQWLARLCAARMAYFCRINEECLRSGTPATDPMFGTRDPVRMFRKSIAAITSSSGTGSGLDDDMRSTIYRDYFMRTGSKYRDHDDYFRARGAGGVFRQTHAKGMLDLFINSHKKLPSGQSPKIPWHEYWILINILFHHLLCQRMQQDQRLRAILVELESQKDSYELVDSKIRLPHNDIQEGCHWHVIIPDQKPPSCEYLSRSAQLLWTLDWRLAHKVARLEDGEPLDEAVQWFLDHDDWMKRIPTACIGRRFPRE